MEMYGDEVQELAAVLPKFIPNQMRGGDGSNRQVKVIGKLKSAVGERSWELVTWQICFELNKQLSLGFAVVIAEFFTGFSSLAIYSRS